MQVLEAAVAQTANPWPLRRERAAELATRYPHAAQTLLLYQAVIHVHEAAYVQARSAELGLEDVPNFAVSKVLPEVVDATVAAGPARLRDGVISVFCSADLVGLMRRWLAGESPSPAGGGGSGRGLSPFETYLARASVSPLLEALSPSALAPKLPSPLVEDDQGGGMATRCPNCGGLPQLSYFAFSGEALVSGPRYLLCSRCHNSWVFSRMTCASCRESDGKKLPVYQEDELFPHARVDGCRTCQRYLLTFDLRRDSRALPVVDELACLPLDLFARDQGLTKITPNMMGN